MARPNTSRSSSRGSGRQFQQILVGLGIALFIVGIIVSGLIGSIGFGPTDANTDGEGPMDDDQSPVDETDDDSLNGIDDEQEIDDTDDGTDVPDNGDNADDIADDPPTSDEEDDTQPDDDTTADDDVGVNDDTDDDAVADESIWDIEAEDLPNHAYIGETVTLSIFVENIGDGFGETDVTLTFDDEEVAIQTVEGGSGYRTHIQFDFETSDREEGSYWMSVRTDDGDIRWMIELESDEDDIDDDWADDGADDWDDDANDDDWEDDTNDDDWEDDSGDDDWADDDADDADDDDSRSPFFPN